VLQKLKKKLILNTTQTRYYVSIATCS